MASIRDSGEIGVALSQLELSEPIPDVLAGRYATDQMRRIWSPVGTVLIERHVQIAIMQAQADLGVDIPQAHIDTYKAVAGHINLTSILEREKKSKHDVNARIAEFNALAGHQHVGIGLTSRDHTENSEQYQKRLALELIRFKMVATIGAFASQAALYSELPITGRTHNVPAQMTTFGKRLAGHGEEMMDAYESTTGHLNYMKLRGIKGAVGTQQDLLDLFDGYEGKVDELDKRIAKLLGFVSVYNSTGQIYPRSQDLETIQVLSKAVAPLSNFALTVRHMQGDGLLVETKKKRVGSNAMPHKINPRTSERINGFYDILGGYEAMLRPKAGGQWLEGDVSESVIRRVALPGSFFAADGAFESGLTVLNGFGLFEKAIEDEVNENMPFLATTKVLTAAIKKGMGREDAHEKIREHAFAVVTDMRDKGALNDLLQRLADDPSIPMTIEQITRAIETPLALTGRAGKQVEKFVQQASSMMARHPEAANYKPGDIL